ncbi:MAG: hypothetical protein ACLRWQ_02455 [Flavonifractor plautii]
MIFALDRVMNPDFEYYSTTCAASVGSFYMISNPMPKVWTTPTITIRHCAGQQRLSDPTAICPIS